MSLTDKNSIIKGVYEWGGDDKEGAMIRREYERLSYWERKSMKDNNY